MIENEVLEEIVKQLKLVVTKNPCEWVLEEKITANFPFTKRQLESLRKQKSLIEGYHYKALGKEKSIDGSRRGKKTLIYHVNRMNEFIERL